MLACIKTLLQARMDIQYQISVETQREAPRRALGRHCKNGHVRMHRKCACVVAIKKYHAHARRAYSKDT